MLIPMFPPPSDDANSATTTKLFEDAVPRRVTEWTDTQRTAILQFNALLRLFANRASPQKHRNDCGGDLTHQRAVFLDGERGSGKTTVLTTLACHWSTPDDENRDARPGDDASTEPDAVAAARTRPLFDEKLAAHVIFLPVQQFEHVPDDWPLAPWLLGAFLHVVKDCDSTPTDVQRPTRDHTHRLAAIEAPWEERQSLEDRLQKAHDAALLAWTKDGPTTRGSKEVDSWAHDTLERTRAWQFAGERIRSFFDAVASALRARHRRPVLIVLPIDDLDLRPKGAQDILRALQMVQHPMVMVVVSGDIAHFEEQLVRALRDPKSQTTDPQAKDLAGKLVEKYFPPPHRVKVEPLSLKALDAFVSPQKQRLTNEHQMALTRDLGRVREGTPLAWIHDLGVFNLRRVVLWLAFPTREPRVLDLVTDGEADWSFKAVPTFGTTGRFKWLRRFGLEFVGGETQTTTRLRRQINRTLVAALLGDAHAASRLGVTEPAIRSTILGTEFELPWHRTPNDSGDAVTTLGTLALWSAVAGITETNEDRAAEALVKVWWLQRVGAAGGPDAKDLSMPDLTEAISRALLGTPQMRELGCEAVVLGFPEYGLPLTVRRALWAAFEGAVRVVPGIAEMCRSFRRGALKAAGIAGTTSEPQVDAAVPDSVQDPWWLQAGSLGGRLLEKLARFSVVPLPGQSLNLRTIWTLNGHSGTPSPTWPLMQFQALARTQAISGIVEHTDKAFDSIGWGATAQVLVGGWRQLCESDREARWLQPDGIVDGCVAYSGPRFRWATTRVAARSSVPGVMIVDHTGWELMPLDVNDLVLPTLLSADSTPRRDAQRSWLTLAHSVNAYSGSAMDGVELDALVLLQDADGTLLEFPRLKGFAWAEFVRIRWGNVARSVSHREQAGVPSNRALVWAVASALKWVQHFFRSPENLDLQSLTDAQMPVRAYEFGFTLPVVPGEPSPFAEPLAEWAKRQRFGKLLAQDERDAWERAVKKL